MAVRMVTFLQPAINSCVYKWLSRWPQELLGPRDVVPQRLIVE